jgi:hypothetical protein
MGMISNFNEFLLESKINESQFIITDELEKILIEISTNKKDTSGEIARILLSNRFDEHEKLNISYFTISDTNNNTIEFYDPDKAKSMGIEDIKGSEIKVGKLIRKLLKMFDEVFTDKDIENFVNTYKAFYDFEIKGEKLFEIMDVKKGIPYSYNTLNFRENRGTLDNSCMNDEEDILNFYINHTKGNLRVLVLKAPNGQLLGRSLIWKTMDNKIFMDRVYTSNDSDIEAFIKYAKDNKWIYKQKQSYRNRREMIPDDNYKNSHRVKLDVDVDDFEPGDAIFSINHGEVQFPYLDTLNIFYWQKGILSNKSVYGNYYIRLQSQYGGWVCDRCYEDGFVACDSPNCGENGCDDCQGNTIIPCEVCGGLIYN